MKRHGLVRSLGRGASVAAIVAVAAALSVHAADACSVRSKLGRIERFCDAVRVGATAADIVADASREDGFRVENRADEIMIVTLHPAQCFVWLEAGRFAGRRTAANRY